jgi:hypothetical protein
MVFSVWSIIVFPIMFIVATLVWAAIIFVLVIYSTLFRKFFLNGLQIAITMTRLNESIIIRTKRN